MNPEVTRALELAQKRYGKNLEGARPAPITPTLAQSRVTGFKLPKVHPRTAFASGQKSKREGFMRVSPYYQMSQADHFWFSGFDGKTMQEAIETQ